MKHFYLREKSTIIDEKLHKGRPVACVVSEKLNLGLLGTHVIFGVSTCNPLDQFDRHEAVKWAIENLARDGGFILPVRRGVKKEIITCIATSHFFPQRARDAAKVWLKEHNNDEIVEKYPLKGTISYFPLGIHDGQGLIEIG